MPGAHRAAVDAGVTANVLFRISGILRTRFSLPAIDSDALRSFICMQEEAPLAVAA